MVAVSRGDPAFRSALCSPGALLRIVGASAKTIGAVVILGDAVLTSALCLTSGEFEGSQGPRGISIGCSPTFLRGRRTSPDV